MLARQYDLLALGECMVEFSAAGALGEAPALRRSCGGDVLNALVAAARLGARTGFITRVGDDPFGASLRQAWADEGVDIRHAPLVAGENGIYFISVAADGEREFSYRRSGSPASQLSAADIDPAYLAESRWLLLSGITQALSASARAATLAAARCAREHGVRVAYDPNYRPRLWQASGGAAAARAAFDEIAPIADWLLPSHPADALLLGGAAQGADALACARQFAARCANVALKCGADGVLLASAAGTLAVPAVPAELVLDSTGAGDAWNGAFLYHLIEGAEPGAAARQANRLASATLAHRGAIPPRP